MHALKLLSAPALLVALALPALAQQTTIGALTIDGVKAISLVPGRPVAVYMTVSNGSDQVDRIVGAYCRCASKAELHEHRMAGDVMMMGEVSEIAVPAHGKVELKPGGYHIMLFDVSGTLSPGDKLPIEVEFEFAGRATLDATVSRPADLSKSSDSAPAQ